jgi:DNA-binding NarL/FixJ family response regulator
VNLYQYSRTIIQAIRTVLDDKLYLSERMMNRVLSRAVGSKQRQPQEQRSPVERLSNREIEIFEMIGRGLTSRQIAQQLDLSQRTVDTHRENIKDKLELKNAVELTKHAVQWVLENH